MKTYIYTLLSCALLVSCGSSVDENSSINEPIDLPKESQELNF